MDKELINAFDILYSSLGTHGKAAKILGLSRDHYCAIRNGRVSIPPRTRDLIILKAQEAASLKEPVPTHNIAREPEFVRV